MATQIGQLKYSVGFDVKKQDLNTLKTQLQQLKKLSLSDLMKINQSDRTAATESFRQIREQAEYVEKAIKDAFNIKLNTTNIEAFNKSLKDSGTSLEKIYNTFKQGGITGQNAFRSLVTQVTTTNTQLKQTHKFLDNIATTLANTVKWNIASSAVNALSNSVQQAWGYVKSLDTSLNDIMIVTGKSADEMAKFSVQANEAAKSLGKTTVDYTKAALIYAQQGLSDDQIAARAAITLKTANVTGQSTDQVSEELTSVWNGYKVNAEQAELYIDRLAAVAASTASDLEELSTGMSKVAAAAAAMGVGEEQLAAQLSTIISVTRQAPESVGTALRTVYARISDIKAGIDEDGVDLGRYSGKMAELGFNVLDVNGKLRDMGQVIEEIGGRWQGLTREQQVSLAQTMAGQRQYSNLIALFDNFEEYNRALGIAQNAAGTLQKQQDTYMESTRAHLNQLKAATEDLYDSLINPDSLQPLMDALSGAATLAARFIDSLGGGGTLLLSLGGIATNVFSDQLTKGVETFVHNLSLGNQQVKIMEASLGVFDQVINIDKLDSSTKAMVENLKNTEQSLAKRATPDQFNQMNDSLGRITASVNEYNKVVASGTELDKQFKKAQDAVGVSFGNIQDFAQQSEEVQNKFSQTLQTTFNGYNEVVGAINNFSSSLNRQNGQIQVSDQNITDLINDLNSIKDTDFLDEGFELPKQNIDNFILSLEKLRENGSNASVFERFTDDIKNYFQDLADATGITVDSIIAKVDQMRESHKKTAQEIEAQQKALQKIKTEQTYRAIGKLSGGFIQLGTAINQASNAGKLFAQGKIGQAATNIGTSLVTISTGALSAAQAMQTLGIATNMALGWLTGIIAVAAAAASAIMGIVKAQQAELEATIKLKQEKIDQQNRKQEQIENNKKLYSSIEELNKQYKQGSISRIELKSAVEDLIDQYGIEDASIRILTGDYDALTEAIKRKRIEAAQEGQRSALTEVGSAKDLISSVGKTGRGRQSGDNYILDLIPGLVFGDESDLINSYFEQAGARETLTHEGSVFRFKVDFDSDSIIQLYDTVDKTIQQIQQDVLITDKQRQDSEIYKTAVEWRDKMADSIKQYRDAQRDLIKYQSELNILHTVELDDVKSVNDYLSQRENIVKAIQTTLDDKGDKTSDAQKMADTYLRDNYRQLFNQFDERGEYTRLLQQKFKNIVSSDKIAKEINNLSQNVFGKLVDYIDLDNISSWGQLLSIIQKLSQIDLSNVAAITMQDGSLGTATDNYTFYQGLEDQIKSGKSISKSEFKKLEESGLQEYFSAMANGQYKLVGDAEQFYNKVNSLKLSGFISAIDEINKKIELTENLAKGNFNYNQLDKNAYTQRPSIISSRNGRTVFDEGVSDTFNEDLYKKQLQYLQTLADEHDGLAEKIINWRAALEGSTNDAERLLKLKDASAEIADEIENVGNQTENTSGKINDLTNELQQAQQALYDAINPTDTDINESALFGLTQVIKDLADDNNEFAESLNEDARAAENVAQAILRFNNAIEDMVKNYETWHGVLTNENVTIQQLAEVIQPLRDAYADLFDIDGSSLSAEFLQSAQNLELMKAAIDGNIESYQQLRQLVTQDIVTHLHFSTEQAQTEFINEFNWIRDWINSNDINFKVGASFEGEQELLNSLTTLINATQMTAAQASDLLHNAFGIDAQVIQDTKSQKVKRTVTGYDYSVGYRSVRGTDPITRNDATFYVPIAEPRIITKEIQEEVPAVGTALKIINAHKTSGGNIKWKHSAQGAGSAGTVRRKEQAEKAAKAAKSNVDTSTKETKKPAEDDRDIYHDINLQLESITRQLNRAQKVQDKLFGKQLIANLNKQSNILEKHKVKLREKQELQKKDLAQKREQLRLLGVIVNEETGNIENYLDALGQKQGAINGLIAQYNSIVGSYNATTDKNAKDAIKDQLTEVERSLKDAETDYKNLETKIKNYDALRKAYEDISDQIKEQIQKQIEINIKRFRMQLEIRLDLGEARRDWNKFKREVLKADNILKDTDFDTIKKNVNQSIDDYDSYFNVQNSNSIQALVDQLTKTKNIIDDIDQNGQNAIYGIDKAQAMQNLQGDLNTLMEYMQNIEGLIQDVDQAILDTVDDISDQAKKQIEDYEFVNDLYQHDMDLLQLLYGDKQYDAMDAYYQKQQQNQLKQIDFLKQYRDLAKNEWDAAVARGQTNLAEKWKQEYMDAVRDINAAIVDSVQLLKNKYTNAVNQIFDSLQRGWTGGRSLQYIDLEWELINKNADEYLDTINAAYAVQQLERKYQRTISDNNTSIKNQRVLTDLMNEQLDSLRTKEKLTQYDIDRAEKLLQIERARMALEDVKNAKTSLRLKRDSQGNYSYVYSANQDDILAAEQQLAKLQNDLYNFDKDAYNKNLSDILAATKEFQERYKEIILSDRSEEDKMQMLKKLRDEYNQYITNKATENIVIRQNLTKSAFNQFAELYNQDYVAFEQMTDDQINKFLGDLVPGWNSGVQQMTNTFAGPGGFIATCEQAFIDLDTATNNYESQLDELQKVADRDFGELKQGIDNVTLSFVELMTKNGELIDQMNNEINDINALKNQLELLRAKYEQVYNQAKLAVEQTNEYLEKQKLVAAEEAKVNATYNPPTPPQQEQNLPAAPQTIAPTPVSPITTGQQQTSGANNVNTSDNIGKITKAPLTLYEGLAGAIYHGLWGSKIKQIVQENMVNVWGINTGTTYFDNAWKKYQSTSSFGPASDYADFSYEHLKQKQKWLDGTNTNSVSTKTSTINAQSSSSRTAADSYAKKAASSSPVYTSGEHGGSGGSFTQHGGSGGSFNSGSILDNIKTGVQTAVNSALGSIGIKKIDENKSDTNINQNVKIEASFPSVNSKKEIEQAFTEIVNLAAQRAMKTIN